MYEILVSFLLDIFKPFLNKDFLVKSKKEQYFKHIIRLVLNLSCLADQLELFCEEINSSKQELTANLKRNPDTKYFHKIWKPVTEINHYLTEIGRDYEHLREWTILTIDESSFTREFKKFLFSKAGIFHVWNTILQANEHNNVVYNDKFVLIPCYSLLLCNCTLEDMAIACHQLDPGTIWSYNYLKKRQFDKMGVKHGKGTSEYDYDEKMQFRAKSEISRDTITLYNKYWHEISREVSFVKKIPFSDVEREYSEIYVVTKNELKKLNDFIALLKKSMKEAFGDDQSDIIIYL